MRTRKKTEPLRVGKKTRDRSLQNGSGVKGECGLCNRSGVTRKGRLSFIFSDRSGVTGKDGLFFVNGGGWELRSRMSKLHASTEHGLRVRGVLGSRKGEMR